MKNQFLKLSAIFFCALFWQVTFSSNESVKAASSLLSQLTYSCKNYENVKELSAWLGEQEVGVVTYQNNMSDIDGLLGIGESAYGKAKIVSVDVCSGWRRNGIASELLEIALANIRSAHKQSVEIFLEAFPDKIDRSGDLVTMIVLDDLVKFYEKHGAQIVEQFPPIGIASSYIMKFPAISGGSHVK